MRKLPKEGIAKKISDNKLGNKRTKNKNRVFSARNILILIFVVVVLLLVLVVIESGVLNRFDFENDKVLFNVLDRCSIIAGKLIHTMEDEGICRNLCRAECETREMEFEESSFFPNVNGCHKCDCYCS